MVTELYSPEFIEGSKCQIIFFTLLCALCSTSINSVHRYVFQKRESQMPNNFLYTSMCPMFHFDKLSASLCGSKSRIPNYKSQILKRRTNILNIQLQCFLVVPFIGFHRKHNIKGHSRSSIIRFIHKIKSNSF